MDDIICEGLGVRREWKEITKTIERKEYRREYIYTDIRVREEGADRIYSPKMPTQKL